MSKNLPNLPSLLIGTSLLLLAACTSDQERKARAQATQALASSPLALFSAMESQNEDLALNILRIDDSKNGVDENGRSALMVAARTSNARVAWQLLPGSAKSLPNDKDGVNALVHAARANEAWLVGELLKRGASPDVTLSNGGSLLAECAQEGRSASVSLLLAHGADQNSTDQDGRSLMEIATSEGQIWLAKDLIKRGNVFENVSKLTEQGVLLSHVVAKTGKPELISILADRGLDLNVTNELGETPIHTAVGHGSFDVIRPFYEQGIQINQADYGGMTPLHLAVMRRDPDSVRELLSLGANPNRSNPQNQLPIDLALEMRDYEFATLLLQYDSNLPGSLLYSAVLDDDRNLISFLLENGSDPNDLASLSNDTALGAAIRTNNAWATSRLLKAGAFPDALTREGQTAFHLAVAKLDHTATRLLLEHGANPNLPFYDYPSDEFLDQVASTNISKSALSRTKRFTPIAMVADSGDDEMARLLLKHGTRTDIYTRSGRYHYWYPISWAARRSDISMMQLILGREPSEVKRRALVDLSKQRAFVYDGDEQIYTTRVSTGKAGHRTRTGTFVITNRYRNWNSTLYGSSMPYFQRFSCGDFGFHQGHVPGYAASHGCIRVPWGGVQQLWKLLSLGDTVKIVP